MGSGTSVLPWRSFEHQPIMVGDYDTRQVQVLGIWYLACIIITHCDWLARRSIRRYWKKWSLPFIPLSWNLQSTLSFLFPFSLVKKKCSPHISHVILSCLQLTQQIVWFSWVRKGRLILNFTSWKAFCSTTPCRTPISPTYTVYRDTHWYTLRLTLESYCYVSSILWLTLESAARNLTKRSRRLLEPMPLWTNMVPR